MNNKWVSYSPHILSKASTTKIYITMLVLLCPILACAVIMFGFKPLALIVVSMLSCYVTDIVFKYAVNKRYDFADVSALFIGFIIGIAMPTGASWYVPILGSCFSIVFIRNIAGGIGKNFVSEIAVAVLISSLVFEADYNLFMTTTGEVVSNSALDSVIAGEIQDINIKSLLFGGLAGSIADASLVWLIVAGVLMIVFKLIDFKIPLTTIASVFLFAIIFFDVTTAVNLTLTGGVVLGAFFMASDYAVVPKNELLKYVYAVAIGLVTVLIWKFGNYSMAIYYAIIIMGLICSALSGIIKTFKVSKVR